MSIALEAEEITNTELFALAEAVLEKASWSPAYITAGPASGGLSDVYDATMHHTGIDPGSLGKP